MILLIIILFQYPSHFQESKLIYTMIVNRYTRNVVAVVVAAAAAVVVVIIIITTTIINNNINNNNKLITLTITIIITYELRP